MCLLSYNCVGPEVAWADADRAGCNFLRMETSDGRPVTPPSPLVAPTAEALARLRTDIAAARAGADLLVVALHKGIVHTPAKLAPYERPLAEAALDAGADIVVGHHAHIVRGVELRNGTAAVPWTGQRLRGDARAESVAGSSRARRVGQEAQGDVRLRA